MIDTMDPIIQKTSVRIKVQNNHPHFLMGRDSVEPWIP
jgi:hypothetical protein